MLLSIPTLQKFEFATILERALCNIASGNKNYRCFVFAYQGRSQLFDWL